MTDSCRNNFHAKTNRLFQRFRYVHLNVSRHVMEIVDQDDKVAVGDLLDDLRKPRSFADGFIAHLGADLSFHGPLL